MDKLHIFLIGVYIYIFNHLFSQTNYMETPEFVTFPLTPCPRFWCCGINKGLSILYFLILVLAFVNICTGVVAGAGTDLINHSLIGFFGLFVGTFCIYCVWRSEYKWASVATWVLFLYQIVILIWGIWQITAVNSTSVDSNIYYALIAYTVFIFIFGIIGITKALQYSEWLSKVALNK